MRKLPFKKHSLLFAPMEGVTDPLYREAIQRAFPEWDYFATDFLRIPTVGHLKDAHLISHLGTGTLKNPDFMKKTAFQILTTARAQTEQTVNLIANNPAIHHLDLNLGCPSRKVNAHKGGSYLLSDLPELKIIIAKIRKNFKNTFTVKMRIGYKDDLKFIDSLKLLEDEGVEAITLHARTRDQLYKGIADWSYIKKAVQAVNIPIIGNGDIWTVQDAHDILQESECHSIMLGRGALKTPWFAALFNAKKSFSTEELLAIRKEKLLLYFTVLEEIFTANGYQANMILKKFKAFSRYLFDDFVEGERLKSKFLRAKTLEEFKDYLTLL